MLLIVTASGLVFVTPNVAVSATPGFPVLGTQFALTFQFPPGGATFQRKVAAFEMCETVRAAERRISRANTRELRYRGIIETAGYQI
jgi:hypothetical protein